jgi:(1->4)-alpha-D-glucan 1-alpha-D-glucosylmutase
VQRFVAGILDRRRSPLFLQSLETFQARIAEFGIYNSLAQLLIKITAPGIPDFYQGTELWDLNLVDPDNRRPVDYVERCRILEQLRTDDPAPDVTELLAHRRDGRVKAFTMAAALAARTRWRDLFEQGDYLPLPIAGGRRDSVFAFARRHGTVLAITCVPRLIASVIPDAAGPPLAGTWLDTRLELPGALAAAAPRRFRDAFTGATIEARESDGVPVIPVSTLFETFPAALLLPCSI